MFRPEVEVFDRSSTMANSLTSHGGEQELEGLYCHSFEPPAVEKVHGPGKLLAPSAHTDFV
jgi:hypothetical protein